MIAKNSFKLALVAFMAATPSCAFLMPAPDDVGIRTRARIRLWYQDLPTVDDVSHADFTEQVYHASVIVRALGTTENKKDKELIELLTAQLSHYDGMRGFFAAYVTGQEGETAADSEKVPSVLLNVIKGADFEILAPLACMNLIAPTAMMSVYTDPTLTANSSTVAQRTKKILTSLKGSANIVRNCHAILVVATGTKNHDADAKLVSFWNAVFEYNAYTNKQRQDIADAFVGVA